MTRITLVFLCQRKIVAHIQTQPRGFAVLIELELFVDIHGVNASVDPNPDAPRSRICRLCANEVLLWGLRDWWVRERQKGFLDETVLSRKDCTEGSACGRQNCLGES
jgi:E3 ubiquitin-protein ligase CHFR